LLAAELHEHVVVRHDPMRVARPMPGAVDAGGSFLYFVSDLHSLERMDAKARMRLAVALHEHVVVRHEAMRVARPMPGLNFVAPLHPSSFSSIGPPSPLCSQR